MSAAAMPPPVRPPVTGQVGRFVGIALGAEEQLRAALLLVAERHERDAEIATTATNIAGWSAQDLEWLRPYAERYGTGSDEHPSRLRGVLFGGARTGETGVLDDLRDLDLLAVEAENAWTVLFQGAKELGDAELSRVAADSREHIRRIRRWIRTAISHDAPETLAVAIDEPRERGASMPRGLDRVAAIPEVAWAPGAAGVSVAVVAVASVLTGWVFLLPSLGPTAALVAAEPAAPTARTWNIVGGHAIGFLAGVVSLAVLGAASSPTVFADHVLAPGRAAASVIAIALTVVAGVLLHASHPPASATTLLVTLGGITTVEGAIGLATGVLIVALMSAGIREIRTRRVAPAERRAPVGGLVARWTAKGRV